MAAAPRSSRLWVAALLLLALLLSAGISLWDVTPKRRGAAKRSGSLPPSAAGASSSVRDPDPPEVRSGVKTRRENARASTPAPGIAPEPFLSPTAVTPADPESRCGGIGAFGTCEKDVAKACVGNRLVIADCGRAGGRCAITSEGAQCLVKAPNGCRGTEPTSCIGSRLQRCVDGFWEQIDCAMRDARCVVDRDGAGCEADASPRRARQRGSVELCDGHDNDLDEHVDEHDVCGPVPLVAFVPEGFSPRDLEARMQQELVHLNRMYAPTEFFWHPTLATTADLRRVGPRQVNDAATALGRGKTQGFYVPVLYVEELVMSPPKSGISTLPNNRCGGVRITDRPALPSGLIVLAESRQPETLAHEVGHYLGLCHTHEDVTALAEADAARQQVCQLSGDGICDTPFDPGPERCDRDKVCDLSCPSDDAQPDPTNLMSYYIGCRRQLTHDQLTETQRNLGLRRDWLRCLDAATCPCTPGDTHACPHEMSCRPEGALDGAWRCELEGPALPGNVCEDTLQCSQGAFCLRARVRGERTPTRCVRACTGEADCTCVSVGLPVQVCAEDVPEATPR